MIRQPELTLLVQVVHLCIIMCILLLFKIQCAVLNIGLNKIKLGLQKCQCAFCRKKTTFRLVLICLILGLSSNRPECHLDVIQQSSLASFSPASLPAPASVPPPASLELPLRSMHAKLPG